MSRIPSIQKPLYIVVRNESDLCYFEPDVGESEWQPQVTDDLDLAKSHCDHLRGMWPDGKYEIKQLSYTTITHPGPDWNQGM